MPRPAAPPLWTTADLLQRLLALLALQHAHIDLHPEAYQNPSGELLRVQVDAELLRMLRRDESTD